MSLAIERDVETIQPAGGTWTTLHDMEHYVETELAEGVPRRSARGLRRGATRARQAPRAISRPGRLRPWALASAPTPYAGLRTLAHDGGAFGFGTTMFLLPDQHAGIIIFTNIRNGSPKG